MNSPPIPEEVPAGEVLPLILFVLLIPLGSVTAGIYQGLGRPEPDALPYLETLATWLAVCAWFSAYARRHRLTLVMDFGWLVLGLWMVAVPYFLFRTQRWRALVPLAAYVLLAFVAAGLGSMVRVAVSGHMLAVR